MNARDWWEKHVSSGAIDESEQAEDGTPEMIVFLTYRDLIAIHEALERQFVARKAGRFNVLHATVNIRRAIREVMADVEDEEVEEE